MDQGCLSGSVPVSHARSPGFRPPHCLVPVRYGRTWPNPDTWELENRRIRSEFETSLGYITRPCLKKKTPSPKKAEVFFTLLVQIFIKYLLYTELQNGIRKTGEGLRDFEGTLVIFSLVARETLGTVRGCRTAHTAAGRCRAGSSSA